MGVYLGEKKTKNPSKYLNLIGFLGKIGADEGTRTPDPRITNALLYQLSYIGAGRLLASAPGLAQT